MSDTFNGLVSPLPHLGLIYVSGKDSLTFLQGQTTIDVSHLATTDLAPGAICNPKGRVIASFMATAWEDGVILVLSADLVAVTLAHLKKYAAFFKTDLSDATKRWHVLGIDHPITGFEAILATPRWDKDRHLTFIDPLAWDYEQCLEACLSARKPVDENTWKSLDIQRGLAWIDLQSTGEHTPHHLNLQWNQGINFKKGCYTGQEVVSRMQFKAKLKSFAYALHAPVALVPMQSVYNREGKAVGTVVNAALDWALAVVQIKWIADGLYADDAGKTALTLVPLPYQDAIQATLDKQSAVGDTNG